MAALLTTIRTRPWLAALVVYLGLSALLFARPAAPWFGSVYMGLGIDQTFFIWCLVWWPYAIAHHLNPFVCKLIFAPEGFNLAWATSIPLISLLCFPLTATVGPIATFNLLCVLLPALGAWTAFLLCHHLTARFWPSMMGGYVFGFSSYMLAHLLGGHLSLCAILLIPLAVYLVLMRLEERMSQRIFTLLLLVLLVSQFLISTEVLTTMTLFGGIALAARWAIGPRPLRRRIAALAGPLMLAYLGMAALMSPYLYYVFAGFRAVPIYSSSWHSADLLNFVVPTRTVEFGHAVGLFAWICARFTSDVAEQGAYLGLPLVVITGWLMLARRDRHGVRLLALMLAVTLLAAMGPRFHVAGQASFKLPWSLLDHMPLLNQALPVRFTVYCSLIFGIAAAMWLSMERLTLWLRGGAAMLVLASLFPNPSVSLWMDPARQTPPAFFTSGMYRRYLAPGETVATLPFAWGKCDYAMLWQAISGMYFRLAAGYFPLTPQSYLLWPATRSSLEHVTLGDPASQWKAFAADHGVDTVIFAGSSPATDVRELQPILAMLGPPAARAGGVELFRVSPPMLAPYRGIGWAKMEALEDEQRFAALLIAARDYLASGREPAELSPKTAARMGLLPVRLAAVRPNNADYPVVLSAGNDGRVRVGLNGTEPAVRAVIKRYGSGALQIYYPFPFLLGRAPAAEHHRLLYQGVVMVFDRGEIERAAASALKNLPRLETASGSSSSITQ